MFESLDPTKPASTKRIVPDSGEPSRGHDGQKEPRPNDFDQKVSDECGILALTSDTEILQRGVLTVFDEYLGERTMDMDGTWHAEPLEVNSVCLSVHARSAANPKFFVV